jgi:hypothetical protein
VYYKRNINVLGQLRESDCDDVLNYINSITKEQQLTWPWGLECDLDIHLNFTYYSTERSESRCALIKVVGSDVHECSILTTKST